MAVAWADCAKFGTHASQNSRTCQRQYLDPRFLNIPSRNYYSSRPSKEQAQSGTLHLYEQRSRNKTGIRSAEITDLKQSSVGVGPRGMLLVGFSREAGDTVAAWMQQMEPGFPVSNCTPCMLKGTVLEAVCQGGSDTFRVEGYTAFDEPLPRLVLLSGMSGEETIAIAEHWEVFTGTTPPIIATLVEKLLQRSLQDAILDIVKSFSISKNRSRNTADTAGLRDMIKKKLDQRQAQAGRRLISRDTQPSSNFKSQDFQDTIYVQQRNNENVSEESNSTVNSRVEEHHQKMNAAQQQLEELRSSLPKRAQGQKRVAGRREQKLNREKRGFG